jgi:cell cycle sensor histidine kinase DivJ
MEYPAADAPVTFAQADLRDERRAPHSGSVTHDLPDEPSSLALLGHELRTPLNVVLGYADAMRGEAFGPLPSVYRDQADSIHAAASHLLALVDAMTAIAAAETGERRLDVQRLDGQALDGLIADVVRLFSPLAAASRVQIRTSAAGPVGLRIDPLALRQILINLIDNAVKFARPGGVVTVAVERASAEVRLRVDNAGGAGAAAGRAGSGLGLRLARALGEAMGGSLDLNLAPEGGAQAVVRFPAITED